MFGLMYVQALFIMDNVYEVEEILDQAILNNEPHYLIKWKNFSHDSDTWEPLSQLSNIIEYLQHWLRKRRSKDHIRRDAKGQSFSSIKSFLYGGELLSNKRMIKKQYERQILASNIISEKNIGYEGKHKESIKSNLLEEKQGRRRGRPKARQVIEEMKNIKQQEASELSQEEKQKEKQNMDNFKIVGEIDSSKIVKILHCFNWNNTRCLSVKLTDGKCWNMVEDDLRVVQPELLIDFYESNGIPF